MTSKVDKRGRIYLPKEIREKHGQKYRIVELPSHVALFPVADDPRAAIEDEVGDALAGKDVDDYTLLDFADDMSDLSEDERDVVGVGDSTHR